MHLFGLLGIAFFLIGFIIAGYLTYAKFILMEFNMTDRPLFYLGMLCMLIGSQLFLAGFLGELIIRNKSINHDHFYWYPIYLNRSFIHYFKIINKKQLIN